MHEKFRKPVSKRVLSVAEFAEALGLSRGLADRVIRENRVRSLRLGRRILIPSSELDRLLAGEERTV